MQICSAQRKNLSNEFKKCLTVFSALGDYNRQQIFIAILEADPVGSRVPDIAKKVNLSRPAVSHHIKILREAKLIDMRRVGTMNYYYADAAANAWASLKSLIDHIEEVVPNAVDTGYPYIDPDE